MFLCTFMYVSKNAKSLENTGKISDFKAFSNGGEGEIRTLEPCYRLHDFQKPVFPLKKIFFLKNKIARHTCPRHKLRKRPARPVSFPADRDRLSGATRLFHAFPQRIPLTIAYRLLGGKGGKGQRAVVNLRIFEKFSIMRSFPRFSTTSF